MFHSQRLFLHLSFQKSAYPQINHTEIRNYPNLRGPEILVYKYPTTYGGVGFFHGRGINSLLQWRNHGQVFNSYLLSSIHSCNMYSCACFFLFFCFFLWATHEIKHSSFLAPEDQSGEDELSANSSVTQIVEIQRFSSIFVECGQRWEWIQGLCLKLVGLQHYIVNGCSGHESSYRYK